MRFPVLGYSRQLSNYTELTPQYQGAPPLVLHCPLLFWCHPVEEGSQGAATLADLAFAPDVNDELSESEKVCFFTSQICQPCSIPLSEFEVES